MQTLKQTLNEAVKNAMKQRQTERLATLRFLTAAIKQKEVDQRIELNDEQVLQIIEKQIKQRKESIQSFEQAGRTDRAESEKAELAVLMEFMPTQLSESEIQPIVDRVVADLAQQQLTGGAAMGKAMGTLKAELAGKADMSLVAKMLKVALSK